MKKQLVRLYKRPSRDGKRFTFVLHYIGDDGKRNQKSLGHADPRKAERQRAQFEHKLRMGIVSPGSLKISEFVTDSRQRTGAQVRLSTHKETESAARDFIKEIGDIDIQKITLKQGKEFRRSGLDRGNAPATVGKKIAHLKALLQSAVEDGYLEENPFKFLKKPKVSKKKIVIFSENECQRIIQSAREYIAPRSDESILAWDVLIALCLETGMRKGELLNLVWPDVDFENNSINIKPKIDSEYTWRWDIKDADERPVPVSDEGLVALATLQQKQPDGFPYVFVPTQRYERIMALHKQGQWSPLNTRQNLINNFSKHYYRILKLANARQLNFHVLRATALSFWIQNGMSAHDVMRLAGHSNFATTKEFYLAVKDDLVDRARELTPAFIGESLSRARHAPHSGV